MEFLTSALSSTLADITGNQGGYAFAIDIPSGIVFATSDLNAQFLTPDGYPLKADDPIVVQQAPIVTNVYKVLLEVYGKNFNIPNNYTNSITYIDTKNGFEFHLFIF